jgi:hypothetical protein
VTAYTQQDREPGDFALDPLGFCKDAEKKKRYQLAELKVLIMTIAKRSYSGMIHCDALRLR